MPLSHYLHCIRHCVTCIESCAFLIKSSCHPFSSSSLTCFFQQGLSLFRKTDTKKQKLKQNYKNSLKYDKIMKRRRRSDPHLASQFTDFWRNHLGTTWLAFCFSVLTLWLPFFNRILFLIMWFLGMSVICCGCSPNPCQTIPYLMMYTLLERQCSVAYIFIPVSV